MKLQRSTLALVTTALLLGGIVLFIEARQANRPTTVQGEGAAPVYDFEEAAVVGLRIETPTQTVIFEREAAGAWQMTAPEEHPAEEAAIAFLLSRLTTNGLVDTTTVDVANQAEFGLDTPQATIEATLQDGTTHMLVLGDAEFSGQSYYALIDPENVPLPENAGEVMVALVSEDIANGVDRPLDEWKAVVATPEPSADAEEPEASEAEPDAAEATEPVPANGEPETVDAETPAADTEPSESQPSDPVDAEGAEPPEAESPASPEPDTPVPDAEEPPASAPDDTETPP